MFFFFFFFFLHFLRLRHNVQTAALKRRFITPKINIESECKGVDGDVVLWDLKQLITDQRLAGSGRREPRTSCIMYEGQPTATCGIFQTDGKRTHVIGSSLTEHSSMFHPSTLKCLKRDGVGYLHPPTPRPPGPYVRVTATQDGF